jgi:transcription elongation factor SPT5
MLVAPEKAIAGEATHSLAPGDMVEVSEGELIHLQGKVIKVDGNKVTILPKHEDLKVSVCQGHVTTLTFHG